MLDHLTNPHLPADTGPVPNPLPKLLTGEDLPREDARHLFERLVLGRLEPGEIGGMLIALRMKGETPEEMIGAAQALSSAATDFNRPDTPFADCCGTGGDNSGIINVSTAAGLVAAACGLPVAKHGNRSVSSKCGSADVLQALGARLDVSPSRSREMLDALGFCFLFAPSYHPGMRHAALVRRQLGVRTVMNLLGPCINPARPPIQLLGVADPAIMRRVANVLQAVGTRKALVVHGAGLDEIALHGETRALRIDGDTIKELVFSPEEAGVDPAPLTALRGGDANENAARLRAIFDGTGPRADRDMVSLNTAGLLLAAGRVDTLAAGAVEAQEALASGAAARVLEAYVEATDG